MSCFRRAWQNLNFYKEYLFGFETLVFATSGILSMHKQIVTLQRVLQGRKRKSHHIQFKIICIVLFTIQLLQSSFTGN